MEKYFFAFLDKLGHLEAKNKYSFLNGKQRPYRHPPVNGNFPLRHIFFYLGPLKKFS